MRGCPWQCRFCQSTTIKRPAPLPDRRDDRQRRAGKLQEHRVRRDQPAVALDQRLSQVRGTRHADERGLHPAQRQDLAAEPPDHRDAQEDPRPLAGRAARRPDARPRGRPRRHARADPQADRQQGPVRRGGRGVPPRLAEGQAVLPLRPPRRAPRRPRRDRRDGRDHRQDRQGRHRALCRRGGQRVQLRPEAAHPLPVERDARAGILPVGPPLPPPAGQDQVGDAQVPRRSRPASSKGS